MARLTPEELEQKIHAVLRDQPVRKAPLSLEARVLGEIARRESLPWWHQSYAYWPNPVKLAFLVLATGLAGSMLLYSMHWIGVMSAESFQQITDPVSGAFNTLRAASSALIALVNTNLPEFSSTYVYAALALLGGAYAVMLGLGATAYRILWQHR